MFERHEPPAQPGRHGESSYEYLVLSVLPGDSLAEARAIVRERAEFGRWELARTLIYQGGARRYWLRRRVMRVRSTLNDAR